MDAPRGHEVGTHLVMSPQEFMQRLAALEPRPRLHLIRFHGVLAPNVNLRVWCSAIAQAAAVQYIAALPEAHHSLFATQPVLEYDRSPHPFRQHLVTPPLQRVEGWVEVPTAPGLGVDVDREVLERYRV